MGNQPKSLKARLLTALAPFLVLLAFTGRAATDAATGGLPVGSRRAALAQARALATDTSGVGQEVRDIMVGSILLVVSFVVSLVMYPILTSSVNTAQQDPNSTATNNTLLGLLPTLFIIVLVIAGVSFLFRGIRGFTKTG